MHASKGPMNAENDETNKKGAWLPMKEEAGAKGQPINQTAL